VEFRRVLFRSRGVGRSAGAGRGCRRRRGPAGRTRAACGGPPRCRRAARRAGGTRARERAHRWDGADARDSSVTARRAARVGGRSAPPAPPYGGSVAERDLYLHEVIDIVGQGQYDYMAHAAREPTNAMPGMLTLQGTFFVCAVGGGRWPQVVNLWDVGEAGWDGWAANVDRLNLKRRAAF